MKFLVVLLVVGLVLWFTLRRDDAPRTRGQRARRAAPRAPQPMVQCAHCGVHLPRDEALAGPDGVFCSDAHRALGHRQA
jgi:uncharacterized protein